MAAFFLLIWVAIAVACGIVAAHKGRNAGLWVVLGLAFGAIALLVVSVLDRVEQQYDNSSAARFRANSYDWSGPQSTWPR